MQDKDFVMQLCSHLHNIVYDDFQDFVRRLTDINYAVRTWILIWMLTRKGEKNVDLKISTTKWNFTLTLTELVNT